MNRNLIKLVLLLVLVAPAIQAQQITTRPYKYINGQDLQLDIYDPENAVSSGRKKPVIILFHGGGLVGGDRSYLKYQCSFFAQRGFVAVSPSYRLISKDSGDVKMQVEQSIMDAKSAVRWVKQHASDLGIDTSMVFLGGGSAGGFLATGAALVDDINENTDDLSISTKAKALILFNPAYIPEKRYAPSPLNYLSAASPPAILFFGSEDTYKPGGDAFYTQLKGLNVPTELWVAKGEKHAFFNKNGWNEASCRQAYNFLLSLKLLPGKRSEASGNKYSLYLQNSN